MMKEFVLCLLLCLSFFYFSSNVQDKDTEPLVQLEPPEHRVYSSLWSRLSYWSYWSY